MKIGGLIAGDDWCFAVGRELGVRAAVLDFFGKAAAGLTLESGSEPNGSWLQWSIVKKPGMCLSPAGPLLTLRAWALRQLRPLR